MTTKSDISRACFNTPLVLLEQASRETGATIYAKCEFFNPLSSVKDRIGLAMIEDAMESGIIKPGDTIVEPTSGNTGIALAFVARVKGLKLVLTMPETMSLERRQLLKHLGATLVLTVKPPPLRSGKIQTAILTSLLPGSVPAAPSPVFPKC